MNTALSRREALRVATLAAASVAFGSIASAAAEGTKIPIGLQLYSVRKELPKDFTGTIEAIGKMGYQGVEFAGYDG